MSEGFHHLVVVCSGGQVSEVVINGTKRVRPPLELGEDWGWLAYERGFDDACADNEEEGLE